MASPVSVTTRRQVRTARYESYSPAPPPEVDVPPRRPPLPREYEPTSPYSPEPSPVPSDRMTPSFDIVTDTDGDDSQVETDVEGQLDATRGRCTCCPYGYHIDVDFLRYFDSLDDPGFLKNLKRIHRDKKKLRRSMEVYLSQGHATQSEPVVKSSTQQFKLQDMVNREEQHTSKFLEQLDSAVSAAVTTNDSRYKTEAAVQLYEPKAGEISPEKKVLTSTEIANNMAQLLPPVTQKTTVNTVTNNNTNTSSRERQINQTYHVSEVEVSNLSAEALQAIREQMAVSLQRLKELEEQVKAIPVLQVRLNVLKEEKRLFQLQLQAKEKELQKAICRPPLVTVGVGSCRVDDDSQSSSQLIKIQQSSLQMDQLRADHQKELENLRLQVRQLQTQVSKPRRPLCRSIGVGDGNVFESSTEITAVQSQQLQSHPRLHEKELHTEHSSHIKEREVKTVFLGSENSGMESLIEKYQTREMPRSRPVRSIGVGDGDVYGDESSNMHVHERETRTVFIGGNKDSQKSTRNVGILCKSLMRDVGMTYHYEHDGPPSRSIAIGVGEIGVDVEAALASGELALSGDQEGSNGGGTSHTTHTHLQQMNMAAYYARHIHIKNDQIRVVLDSMLKKNVSSKGVQCRFATESKGTHFTGVEKHSVECGSEMDIIDVEVRPIRQMKSVSVDIRPSVLHRSAGTERAFQVDESTSTPEAIRVNRGISTEKTVMYPAATSTEVTECSDQYTATEPRIFTMLEARRSVSTGTEQVHMTTSGTSPDVMQIICHKGTNTQAPSTVERGLMTSQKTTDKGINTQRQSLWERGVNTDTKRQRSVGVNASLTPIEQESNSIQEQNSHSETNNTTEGDGYLIRRVTTTKRSYGSRPEERSSQEGTTAISEPSSVKEISSLSLAQPSNLVIKQDDADGGQQSSCSIVTKRSFSSSQGGSLPAREETQTSTYSHPSSTTVVESTSDGDGGESHSTYTSSVTRRSYGLQPVSISSRVTSASQNLTRLEEQLGQKLDSLERKRKVDKPESLSIERVVHTQDAAEDEDEVGEEEDQDEQTSEQSSMWTESAGGRGGRKVIVTETFVERTHDSNDSNGTLRSIMKQPGQDSSRKKEITFSEEVVGGYASAESSDADEEADSEGSSSSYDEGSYDGREGSITYACEDDETIAQGSPGASMYDQSIRETFELSEEMRNACEIYSQWLVDSTQITSKQLTASQSIIQQEWFKVAGQKLSDGAQVEDYLNCFNELSPGLLAHTVNMQDPNGNTVLHYAVSHGNLDVVNLLLDSNLCDVNLQNKAGYTAIMLAALAEVQTESQRQVIRRLFRLGDINSRASQAGQTALMLAVSHGRTSMVSLLLDEGADVNCTDEDGSTALMCASEHGHTDIVKLLLAQPDCEPMMTDNDGSTALSIAMEAGHRDIGVLLYAHVNFKHPQKYRVPRRSSSSSSLPSPRSQFSPN